MIFLASSCTSKSGRSSPSLIDGYSILVQYGIHVRRNCRARNRDSESEAVFEFKPCYSSLTELVGHRLVQKVAPVIQCRLCQLLPPTSFYRDPQRYVVRLCVLAVKNGSCDAFMEWNWWILRMDLDGFRWIAYWAMDWDLGWLHLFLVY